jgi:DNA mismatch repair protein MutS
MSEEININKIISDNETKLTIDDIDLISKNIIHNSGWKHNVVHSPIEMLKEKININDNLFQDLEIFISYNHDLDDTVYKKINNTETKLGDYYLKHILLNPTNNVSILTFRQNLVKSLIENPDKHQKIRGLLKKLNEYQEHGLWMWKDKSNEFQQIYEMLYFKNSYLQSFNTSEWFLKIYNYFQIIFIPLYGLFSPIIFFILPYIIVRFFFNIKIPIKLYYNIIMQTFFSGNLLSSFFGKSNLSIITQYLYRGLTIFMYFYGIYNSLKVAYTLNNIINLLHKKVNYLARFIKTSYDLYQECKSLFNLEPLTVSYLELWDLIFEKEPYLLSDKGKILKTFFLLLNGYNKLTPLLQMVGMIDSVNSIACLYLANIDKTNNVKYYSYPIYKNTSNPVINCQEIWNPFLNNTRAVKNDFMIGQNDCLQNNILITGPNASGKSTFIKSVVLGILLSQTLTIVPSVKMEFTPFKLLNTYLNIPDAKGRESLFEAEMYRAKNHINAVKELKNDQFAFVIMDEIFNSTNYEEGVAGAYIIGKELGNINNSLTIITTHFSYLTKLEKTGNYINYMFDVEKVDDKIVKSYKIKKGISKQYLALDLLENNGFSSDMIKEARTIFQELVKRNNQEIKDAQEEIKDSQEEIKDSQEEIKEEDEIKEEEIKNIEVEIKENKDNQ